MEQSNLTIQDSKFWQNSVRQFEGAICMNYGNLTISRSQFSDNSTFQGGVLNALQQCSVRICDSFFDHNVAESEEVPQKAARGVIIIGQTCKNYQKCTQQ